MYMATGLGMLKNLPGVIQRSADSRACIDQKRAQGKSGRQARAECRDIYGSRLGNAGRKLGILPQQAKGLSVSQFAQKQLDEPVPPPGDPIGDQYGNMFSPFSQKKIVKGPVPQRPHIKPEGVPKVAKEQKVWKKGGKGVNMNGDQYGNMFSPFSNKPVEKKEIVQEKLPTERVVKRQRHEQKMEKPREMPKKVIPPTKMIGGVKKAKDPNKGKAYVVNKRPNVWQEGTVDRSKDTLWLDNSYKKMAGSYIDQDDYDDLARKAHSEGSYKRVGVQDLEGGGEIKKKI